MAECDMSLDGPINDTNIQYKFEENAKVPDWHKADQLAMYKRSQGVESESSWNKSSWWSERDLNSGSSDFKPDTLITRPR